MKFKHFAPLALALALTACSTERKAFSPTECNESAAFDRGFSEGKDGRDPDTDYSAACREDLRAAVRKGYREGYDKGRVEYKELVAKRDAEMAEWRRRHSGETVATPPAPEYSCEISYQGRGFQSEGKSLGEARDAIVKQCADSFSFRICNTLPHCQKGGLTGGSSNPRAFYCKLEVFTREYEAFGPTQLETQSALRQKCTDAEKSDFFCKDSSMKCRPNR